jgi:hypothetical protein
MQSSPSHHSHTPEERIPSPPNTPATTAVDDRHPPPPLGHLDTHLYQQKKRREFEADTGLQRMELRIDHDSGPQQKQGTEGKKHKKSSSTSGGNAKSTAPGAYGNSRFFNHLSHYPVLTDAVSQITSHTPQSIVSFIKSHSPNPPADGKNTLPLIGTLDTIADSLLTTIDTYFPVLAKPTPELIDDTVKNVKRPVEGIWNVWAVPVVGTITNPVVGRVNDILVDLFKPQEIIRKDKKYRKKQWKEQQKQNKKNSHHEKSSSSEKPPGRPKTYAEVSATPPPGAKQQQQQKQTHKNQDSHSSNTDDSDNQAQYKRKIKQQNQHELQLQRTYQIFTSILHDTQNTIRDPHTRIYKLPIVGGVVHKAASWAVGPEPAHRSGQGKKKKGGNYPEKHSGPTTPATQGGALDGGESREKYEFAGVTGSENVTVIGGGREGTA